jgi:branched-chain amino acid transport system substrate-binding protein
MLSIKTAGAIAAGAILIASSMGHTAHAAEKTYKIGAPLPLTGGLSPEGLRMKAGYDLWAEKQNAAGGIKAGADSYKVEIIYSDYQSNTPRAVQSAELMITENKVDALFAPFGSGATKAVSAVTEKYGVPMIAAQAASAQVYDQGFKYLFGMYTPNDTVVKPLVDLVIKTDPSIKRVAVLSRNDLFPLAIAEEFIKYAKAKGLEIVSDQKFPIGTVDFSSALTQIRSSKADWIYATGYTNDNIVIRKQMQEQGIKTKLIAMLVGPTSPDFLNNTGKLSENVVTSAWWDPAADLTGNDVFGSAKAFAKEYADRHNGNVPEYSVASAAACGVVLQLAVTKAGTVDKAKVRDQIAALDVNTFYGHIKFGPTGQIVSLKPPTMQIQNGKPTVVDPVEFKQSDIRFEPK